MSTAAPHPASFRAPHDPYALGGGRGGHGNDGGHHGEATGHGAGGPASKRIVVGYGFWIYLLSDIVLFSAFFAAYAVLAGETAGGPSGAEIFDRGRLAIETGCLLLSSYTCGLGSIAAARRHGRSTQLWLAATGVLGLVFLGIEVQEFAALAAEGAGPQRSAFLSAFFALVGLHGLHVGIGLLWLATMMAQIATRGFRPEVERRLLCFNLFWHALDIVWVGVFSIVYLLGNLG
ncbi:cytochrome o ubiquinol oxidase subunit III [Sphingomonas desiccabilis]|uniref:Cytochrome bo(3) ubiquinol oxidase subunit 3 n=1 Tax=Sphingomonas desiccabilis TaxID=429134 RepID=A0A4Q2IKS7_9SPHN|nr:cytochrome o ubiquinol oxidase subunit III [Sphingomonas desiccabilis]MBB3912547.1 cytochrome o ubiquinol oxidase subunit 3 [Sphingomonas desiccabilis]RXZ29851.1 cytochrome o ubiquinol oxidase subunit III [Sphingomonas desiccabilis]